VKWEISNSKTKKNLNRISKDLTSTLCQGMRTTITDKKEEIKVKGSSEEKSMAKHLTSNMKRELRTSSGTTLNLIKRNLSYLRKSKMSKLDQETLEYSKRKRRL